MQKLTILGGACLLGLSPMCPMAFAAEWTYQSTAPVGMEVRNNALFELWVPNDQPAGTPVRGLISVWV